MSRGFDLVNALWLIAVIGFAAAYLWRSLRGRRSSGKEDEWPAEEDQKLR
jgi:hypothetical protein